MDFKTPEIGLASALKARGERFIDIVVEKHSRPYFIFQRSEYTDDLVQSYWRGCLEVEALWFVLMYETMRNRLDREVNEADKK